MSIIKIIKKLFGRKVRTKTDTRIVYEFAIQGHGYEATILIQFGVSQHGYGAYVLLPDGKHAPIMEGATFSIFGFPPKDLVSIAEGVLHKWIETVEQSPVQKEFRDFGFKRVKK